MKYKCEKCGQEHEGWPALAFSAPYHYQILSDEDKETIAELNDDFCVIEHEKEDRTNFFIRGVLIQKVNDHCEDLQYGVWVSLSEKSFENYSENFHNDEHEASYFGWFCNQIADYENTLSIKTNVIASGGGNRPEIILQR